MPLHLSVAMLIDICHTNQVQKSTFLNNLLKYHYLHTPGQMNIVLNRLIVIMYIFLKKNYITKNVIYINNIIYYMLNIPIIICAMP